MSARPRYCASAGCGPLRALGGWMRGGRGVPAWEQFAGRWTLPVHSGRAAIGLLPVLWDMKPGDEILVPAYNCGSEIDPWIRAGVRPILYRVDRLARIDVADLIQRTTERTRAVLVTHYFGWPQDVRSLSAWCDSRRVHLVEDCAHALFSCDGNEPLGRFGDAAVFSPRKSLAVPDGGVLSLKTPPEDSPRLRPASARATFRGVLPLLKRRALQWFDGAGVSGVPRSGALLLDPACPPDLESRDGPPPRPDMPADYYFSGAKGRHSASRTTIGLLRNANPNEVRQRRRMNYERLRECLERTPGVELLRPELPAGVCPLCLPLLVGPRRGAWVKALNLRRIECYPFWEGFHRGLDWREFPESVRLKEQLLTLPVHEQLESEHMNYIADMVQALAAHTRVDSRASSASMMGRNTGIGSEVRA